MKRHKSISFLNYKGMPRLVMVGAFYFFAINIAAAQNVKGLVTDSSTGEPVPYVNIGIIELQLGTVSNGSGLFSLKYKSPSDTVVFSAIGYYLKKLAISDIQNSSRIFMEPKTYDMEEIVVRSDTYSELKVFGNKQEKKGQSFGFGSGELGSEIGAKIKLKRSTLIKSANFSVNFVGESDSMKYRVNLYSMNDGEPRENLIKENIIVSGKQERGTFSVDLSELEIIARGEVILALEWVENPEDLDNSGMMFRAKKVRKKNANAYLRYTSFSRLRKVAVVNNELAFYLEGKEIKD